MPNSDQPQLPPLELALSIVADTPAFLNRTPSLTEHPRLDCFLLLLDALERRSLYNCSALVLGCPDGYFAYLLSVTFCRSVTAIEDQSGDLDPLRRACADYGLAHVEIATAPAHERVWDVVLCLAGTHHEIASLAPRAASALYFEAGAVPDSLTGLCNPIGTTVSADGRHQTLYEAVR